MKNLIKQLLRENFGYRAGDLINKAEKLRNTKGVRGTGHFGTGFYFFGDEIVANDYAKITGNREVNTIDLSKYNLLKINNDDLGYKLHDELKKWDGFNVNSIRPELRSIGIQHLIYKISYHDNHELKHLIHDYLTHQSNDLNYLFDEITDMIINVLKSNDFNKSHSIIGDFIYKFVDDTKINSVITNIHNIIDKYVDNFINNNQNLFKKLLYDNLEKKLSNLGYIISKIDTNLKNDIVDKLVNALIRSLRRDPYLEAHGDKTTLGTELIKSLGYNGIDVRGTSLDNSMYGSVLYDI
jgi:hypothetical protein